MPAPSVYVRADRDVRTEPAAHFRTSPTREEGGHPPRQNPHPPTHSPEQLNAPNSAKDDRPCAQLTRGALALALVAGLAGAPAPLLAQTQPANLADLVVRGRGGGRQHFRHPDDRGQERRRRPCPTCPRARRSTTCSSSSSRTTARTARRGRRTNPRRSAPASSSTPRGIVITNNHVVGDANDIMVIFTDGRKLKAKVLGKDPKVDVAVLKVRERQAAQDRQVRRQRQGARRRRRDGGRQSVRPRRTVTAGILSARNRNIESGPYDDFLQTDAAINKGNSGGPLFNMARRSDRHQHRHPVADRRLDRHRLRDARPTRSAGDRRSCRNSARPAAAGSACASSRSTTRSPRASASATAHGALVAGVDAKRPGQAGGHRGRRRHHQVRRQGRSRSCATCRASSPRWRSASQGRSDGRCARARRSTST